MMKQPANHGGRLTVRALACAYLLAGLIPVHAGTYDAWTHRMKIRFQAPIQGVLTNFPVLVTLSTNGIPGFRYTDFGTPTNGADLRFADSNQTTELYYEIETWNTNGNSHVWVQAPRIATTNDFIYAYWGRTGVSLAPCTTNGATWDASYRGVWHMQRIDAPDSSTNGNHGTAVGAITTAPGKTGPANYFNGSGYINVPATDLFKGSDNVTVEFWFNLTNGALETYADIMDYDHASSPNQNWAIQLLTGAATFSWPINSAADNGNWGPWSANHSFTLAYNQWTHVTLTKDGTTYAYYINGSPLLSGACSSGIDKDGSRQLRFGAKVAGGGNIKGDMDEVRISNTARSSNWIYACWLNQASNHSFLALSDAGPVATTLTISANPATGIGTTNATLNGTVVHAGDAENPTVYVCWDTVDRGTTSRLDWAHQELLGTHWGKGQNFSTNITGLTSGVTYFYRCFVTNSTGEDWSDTAPSFTTVYMPAIANPGAVSVKVRSACLQGRVTDPGAQTPWTWFEYWADGSAITSSVTAGRQSGLFAMPVSPLPRATLYHYRAFASNTAGIATSPMQSFTTRDTLYVAITGDGSAGTNWASAFLTLPDALDAGGDDALILIREGTYAAASPVVVSNLSGITIRGGYTGNTPEPGDLSIYPTILTRGAAASRILYGHASTVTLERITFKDGYLTGATMQGAGLFFTANSEVTLRNCVVTNNSILASQQNHGGGLYINGGTLTLLNCRFENNSLPKADWSSAGYGAGLAVNQAMLTMTNTVFRGHWTRTRHVGTFGGALYLNGGQAEMRNCRFEDNFAGIDGNSDGPGPGHGGAIYAVNVAPLTLSDCYFTGNRVPYYEGVNGVKQGGVLHINGASSRTILQRCVLVNNGDLNDESGDIFLNAGMLALTNVLLAGSSGGSGLFIAGGTATVNHCTFAGNVGSGISKQAGRLTILNSIAKLNTLGGFGGADTVDYSCSQEILDGIGNSVVDPLFADTTYYHLKARAGYHAGGYFSGGVWTAADEDSPLLDAGHPASDYQQEPHPNGFRANMGAYGNSPAASRTFLEPPGIFTNLTVYAHPAIPISPTSVLLRGQVLSHGGGGNPPTYFCWGHLDGGTANTGSWYAVIAMGARPEWEMVTNLVTGLTQGQTYHYRCYVTNSTGQDWSSNVIFTPQGPPVMTNLGPTQLRRHSARLQGQVVSSGGEDPTVWIRHWEDGSASNAIMAMGVQSPYSTFVTNLNALSADTLYHYTIMGSNSLGIAWSRTNDYRTLTTNPISCYVTPTGNGKLDGTSWDHAHPSLPAALPACEYPGDTVYIRHGTYLQNIPVQLDNLSGARLAGGYAGTGTPGPRTNAATIFTRVSDKNIRIFQGNNTTVTLDRITIEGGYLVSYDADGAGLYFTGNSDITLTNCLIGNNVIYISGTADGAGLYINGGRLTVTDCVFTNNRAPKLSWDTGSRGNGIFALNAVSAISGSYFVGNWCQTRHVVAYGGAVCLLGGTGIITNCRFESNRAINEGNTDGPGPARGGAVAALNLQSIAIRDCRFSDNKAYTPWAPNGGLRQGSAIYLSASTGMISRCILTTNGHASNPFGTLYSEGGRVSVSNVLAAYGQDGYGLYLNSPGSSIDSCTAVTNTGWGIRGNGATLVRNSIAWGNSAGGITAASVSYSSSQETHPGNGNLSVDPQFADAVYFHLQSRVGQYAGGYFSGGTWERGPGNSLLIDAGDPQSSREFEPLPNGSRINLGYDGNTPVASKTLLRDTVFLIR